MVRIRERSKRRDLDKGFSVRNTQNMASAFCFILCFSNAFQLVLCFCSSLLHLKSSEVSIAVRTKARKMEVGIKFSPSWKDKVQVVEGEKLPIINQVKWLGHGTRIKLVGNVKETSLLQLVQAANP